MPIQFVGTGLHAAHAARLKTAPGDKVSVPTLFAAAFGAAGLVGAFPAIGDALKAGGLLVEAASPVVAGAQEAPPRPAGPEVKRALKRFAEETGDSNLDASAILRALVATAASARAVVAAGVPREEIACLREHLRTKVGAGWEDKWRKLGASGLQARLEERVAGQAEALAAVARTLAAGVSRFRDPGRPRAVMLLAGPTGVGKTETAMAMAELAGGEKSLIRVDCNALAGTGQSKTAILWQLFGTGHGFIGSDNPGALTRIQKKPDAVVLFDEFEKADTTLGEVLLQILDTGKVNDPQGRALDFRRAFIVFTSNAGVEYDTSASRMGFGAPTPKNGSPAEADLAKFERDILAKGYGRELLGRIPCKICFRGMGGDRLAQAVALQLKAMQTECTKWEVALEWSTAVPAALAARAQASLGVRPAVVALRHALGLWLAEADAAGFLCGSTRVRLAMDGDEPAEPGVQAVCLSELLSPGTAGLQAR